MIYGRVVLQMHLLKSFDIYLGTQEIMSTSLLMQISMLFSQTKQLEFHGNFKDCTYHKGNKTADICNLFKIFQIHINEICTRTIGLSPGEI